MENMEKIGEMYVKSGKVLAIDPCYGRSEVGNGMLCCKVDVRIGLYDVYISRSKDNRIAGIGIVVCDTDINEMCYGDYEVGQVAVVSGTCGFFDNSYHRETHNNNGAFDDWYDKFVVQDCPEYNITDLKGALSSSGYGDGVYPVFRITDEHSSMFGLYIEFIYEGYEDDEDYDQ
jgi:hypothetical protein